MPGFSTTDRGAALEGPLAPPCPPPPCLVITTQDSVHSFVHTLGRLVQCNGAVTTTATGVPGLLRAHVLAHSVLIMGCEANTLVPALQTRTQKWSKECSAQGPTAGTRGSQESNLPTQTPLPPPLDASSLQGFKEGREG